ncbi:MAG: carbonic anhydrase [Candidatus Kerfeldbacteria bacterium]|nr:carbonic anhydrase [Candidatus Kerfeldbacteria bacterium]
MSHQAKALVLHCIDFRFIPGIKNYLHKQMGLKGQYDKVAVAGAAKNLADPAKPEDQEFILRQIDISKRLHAITDLYLINHRDCGAYGADLAADAVAETERHTSDLRAARKLVSQRFPDVTVHLLLAKLGGEHQVMFESVS